MIGSNFRRRALDAQSSADTPLHSSCLVLLPDGVLERLVRLIDWMRESHFRPAHRSSTGNTVQKARGANKNSRLRPIRQSSTLRSAKQRLHHNELFTQPYV